MTQALIKRHDLGDLAGFRLGRWLDTTIPPAVIGGRPLVGIDYTQEMYTADLKLGGVGTRMHASPTIARFFSFRSSSSRKDTATCRARHALSGDWLRARTEFPGDPQGRRRQRATWGRFLFRAFNFLRLPYTQSALTKAKNQKWYGPGAPYHYY